VGQNLVPNGDFEQHSTCPTSISQLNHASHWTSPSTGTPDYHNACGNSNQFCFCGVPENGWGYQVAHSGTGYASIGTTSNINSGNFTHNHREYLQTELTDTLTEGINYCIKFYVSACDSFNYVSNDIGVYFSKVEIHDSCVRACPLPFTPQFENTTTLNDRIEWTEVSGTFLATGGEKFIIIGNFKDSVATVATYTGWDLSPGGFENAAIYYVDDVLVSADSLTCNATVGIEKIKRGNTVNLFPNPFSNELTFQSENKEQTTVFIYNFLGQQILAQTFTSITTLSTEQLPNGIYFYELRNSEGKIKNGKIIKE